MPNILQYPVVLYGALRTGVIVVNVNPLYTPRELEHQLVDSGATAIVVVENFAHTLAKVIDKTAVKTVVTTRMGDMLRAPKRQVVNFVVKYVKKLVPAWQIPGAVDLRRVMAQGKWQVLEDVPIAPDDTAFLQYTGGTTGVSKGAELTHRNMVANLEQVKAWFGQRTAAGGEVIITALPMYHIFSLTCNCLQFLKLGGCNVLITNPRDMPGFVKELKRHRFTVITGVNTLFNGLLNTEGFDKLDFSGLHLSLGGGMAVQRSVAERWKKVTGCTLLEAYGLTETAPAACINPMGLTDYNGSIGLPIPSTDACVRDENGTVWHIPNGSFTRVGNLSQQWARALLDVEVAYGTDLDRASEEIRRVATDLWQEPSWRGKVLEAPEIWGVERVEPDVVALRLVVKTRPASQFPVVRELRRRLADAFVDAGITMRSPQSTDWVRRDPGTSQETPDSASPDSASPEAPAAPGDARQ